MREEFKSEELNNEELNNEELNNEELNNEELNNEELNNEELNNEELKSKEPKKWNKRINILEGLRSFLTFFIMALVLNIFLGNFYEVFKVSGESMTPTLTDGSNILVSMEVEELEHGDIIVFDSNKSKGNLNEFYLEEGVNIQYSEDEIEEVGGDVEGLLNSEEGKEYMYNKYEDGEYMVKRIIGLPGDEVTYDGKEYIVNGETVESENAYLGYQSGLISEGHRIVRGSDVLSRISINDANLILREEWGLEEGKIPDNKYLVMGDNRNNSNDSRFFGLIDKYSIEGKVMAEYGKGFGIFIN